MPFTFDLYASYISVNEPITPWVISMFRYLKMLQIGMRESSPREDDQRGSVLHAPTAELVRAYHRESATDGPIGALFQLCSIAMSGLVPKGGTVLSVGNGAAALMGYLGAQRQDITMIAYEPADYGDQNELPFFEQVADRLTIKRGPLHLVHENVHDRVDLVAGMLACHRLGKNADIQTFFQALKVLKYRNNCSICLVDYIRPRREEHAEAFVDLMFPGLTEPPRNNAVAAVKSSFSFAELSEPLDALKIGPFEHYRAFPLPSLQIHRLRSEKHYESTHHLLKQLPMPKMSQSRMRFFRRLFSKKVFR